MNAAKTTGRKGRPTMPTVAELAVRRGVPADLVPGTRRLSLTADQLIRHPDNVRFDIVLDEETLESIRSHGLLHDVIVAPTATDNGAAETFTIIDGNRRHFHVEELARRGVQVPIPVTVRDDLVTLAQQREVMLITALQRKGISAAEESAAYEQMTLDGMDAATIAKRTGRNPATVKSRLKLGALSDKARTNLHTGQISIGDAEGLASFADDHEAYDRLESVIGQPYFASALRQEQNRRTVAKETAQQVKAAEKDGLTMVELTGGHCDSNTGPSPITWTQEPVRDKHADAGCLAYCVMSDRFYEVCTDPASHQATAKPEDEEAEEARQQRVSDWEKDQAARDARRAAGIAAMQLRAEHLQRLLARTVTVGALGKDTIAVLRLALPSMVAAIGARHVFEHLVGHDRGGELWFNTEVWFDDNWPVDVTDAVVVKTFIAYLAEGADTVLAYSADYESDVPRRLVGWDWLAGTGFDLSEIDEGLYAAAKSDADDVKDTAGSEAEAEA